MFSNELIIKILKYIDNNMYKKISIDDLANYFHYNKDYIMRLFKKEIGYTITNYINSKRIYNSLKSFIYKDLSILNISINYGFYSQEYYCEVFHRIIGVTPSTYHKYINFRSSIGIEDLISIQNNLSRLDYDFRRIDKYVTNVPPKSSIKVLSIFK